QRRVPVRGLDLQAVPDDAVPARVQVRRDRRGGGGLVAEALDGGDVDEGTAAGEDLKGEDAEGEDVDGGLGVTALDLLGGHGVEGAGQDAGQGPGRDDAAIDGAGQAEVHHHHPLAAAGVGDQE